MPIQLPLPVITVGSHRWESHEWRRVLAQAGSHLRQNNATFAALSDREQEEYLLSLSGANIIRLALGFQPKKHGGKRNKGGFQPGNTLSPRHPKNKKQDG